MPSLLERVVFIKTTDLVENICKEKKITTGLAV